MAGYAVVFLRWSLAVVLAAAAIGKVRHRSELADFARILRIGLRLPRARLVAGTWVGVEAVTAIGLAVPVTAGYASVLAVLTFGCLTVGAALLVAQHREFACNCFGGGRSRLSRRTVLRNGALTGAALLLVVGLPTRETAAAPALLAGFGALGRTAMTVLVVYTTVVSTLTLGIALLILQFLHGPTAGDPAPHTAATLPASGPDVGSAAPPFTGRTSTGALLDTAQISGRSYLLAFLSSTCMGCRDALPGMIGYAGHLPSEPGLIAVIVGDFRRGADIERMLAPVGAVVFEPDGGPISIAYRIRLFPSYVLISDTGTVLATGQSVRDLPQSQPR